MLKLEQMTPEQKIGRVLCARRFKEEDDIQFTLEMIKNSACGAVQIPYKPWTAELIQRLRSAADYPLLVINDMERGFPLSDMPQISLLVLAAANDPKYTRAFAAYTASEAKKMGYSGCWGPIVDILRVNGPASVSRHASDTPEGVLEVTEEIYKTFASYHFQATGKHYPGGHDAGMDTHMVGAYSSVTEEELLNFDLVPYFKLMEKGLLPSIMVDHSVYKNIDPVYPASLSKKIIDIIRNRGFDGVVYTDSLAMMAILQTFGEKKAHSMALMAGNDIILSNYRTPTRKIYEMMLEEYRDGFITEERLDEAVRRVMKLEQYCAQTPEAPIDPPQNIVEVMKCAARDSITAECDEGVSEALDHPEKKRLFIVVTPQDHSDDASDVEITMKTPYNPNIVRESIKQNFPSSEVEFIREFPAPSDNDRVLNAASHFEEVVIVSYCSTAAYMGTDCLTRRLEALINALVISGKVKALVHFGNPLALDHILHLPRILLAYNAPSAIPYAFEILAGKYPAKGVNPLKRLTKQYRL